MGKKIISSYVTERQYDRLKEESKVTGISVSSILKRMIIEHFRKVSN